MTSPIILPKSPSLDANSKHCVEVLADALECANEGRISGVALVVLMDDGIATNMAGTNGGALNLGLDHLKTEIHASMFQKKPAIVRAR